MLGMNIGTSLVAKLPTKLTDQASFSRKKEGNSAIVLAFCMVAALFSAVPSHAGTLRFPYCVGFCSKQSQEPAAVGTTMFCVINNPCTWGGSRAEADRLISALGAENVNFDGKQISIGGQDPTPVVKGIATDLSVIRKVAEEDPGAAVLLLGFHPEYDYPTLNLYRGAIAMSGIPTPESINLMIERADEKMISQSLKPIEQGTVFQIVWHAAEPDADTIVATVRSIVTDEISIERRQVFPSTTVVVDRDAHSVTSVSHP